MTPILLLALGVAVAGGALWIAARTQTPSARMVGGVALIAAALGLAAFRQLALAVPVGFLALTLLRGALAQARAIPTPGGRSEVRTAALVMRLDHDTGDMDGDVLRGAFAGAALSELSPAALRDLAAELSDDPDSLGLLLAYLERNREPADAPPPPPNDGAMSETEALRILGLKPGASRNDVRDAHRRLILKVHPDLGGSDALAAMINAAKARLDP